MMTHDEHKIMKRFATLALWVVSCLSSSAQITLGYCDEEGYTGSTTNNNTSATISCAMGVTPALQTDYTFCSISYLRILLTAPLNLTSLKVWIRQELTDEDALTGIDIDPETLDEGWNDIQLPTPIVLTGDKTIYCGYSYTQSSKTRIPTSGHKGTPESFYVSTGSNWRDMSEQHAPVCIRAGLSSNYQWAMELTNLSLEHRWYDIDGDDDTITIHGIVRNLGNEPLHRFNITVQETDAVTLETTFDCEDILFGYSIPFVVSFLRNKDFHQTNPDIPVQLSICLPNGQENQCDYPTTGTVYYELGQSNPDPSTAPTNLLIEEFTSEANGYAPAGQTHLRNSIDRALSLIGDKKTDVILLSRHEGYGPADAWRIPGSDFQANFFGPEELTFAPAAFVCRNGLPFSTTLDEDSIAQMISELYDRQYGNIQVEDVSFDADTHTVTATIKTHLFGISIYRNPTLVVCIKQDKVPSVAQKNYYPERYDDDWQLDVIRSFANLPRNGRLLGNFDLEAAATGQVKLSEYIDQQFLFSDILPSDITTNEGLTLVAYIFDKGFTNKIIAAFQLKILKT